MMFKLTDGTESSDGKPKIIELKEFMDSLYISNWAAEVGKTLTQLVSHTLFCFLAPSVVPNSSYSDYRNNNTNPFHVPLLVYPGIGLLIIFVPPPLTSRHLFDLCVFYGM